MSNLDSMYSNLNRDVDSYNHMLKYYNNSIYADNALVDAYNSMLDIYQLVKYFSIDGKSADNNAIINQHKKILELINDIRKDNEQMRYNLDQRLQSINNQRSRIESERAKQSQGGN